MDKDFTLVEVIVVPGIWWNIKFCLCRHAEWHCHLIKADWGALLQPKCFGLFFHTYQLPQVSPGGFPHTLAQWEWKRECLPTGSLEHALLFIVLVWDTSFKWARFEVRPGSNKIIQNFLISFFCLFVCFGRQILGKPFPCSVINFGTKDQEQPVHKLPNTSICFHNEIQLAILKT